MTIAAFFAPILQSFSSCCSKSSTTETDDIQFQLICCSSFTQTNAVTGKKHQRIDGAAEGENVYELKDDRDGGEGRKRER
jgi:hypothetical protein